MLEIGGWIFWIVVAAVFGLALLHYVTGFVRAVSLHWFLIRLRRAVDGHWLPFKRLRDWPGAFLSDMRKCVGPPWVEPDLSMSFEGRDRPVHGHWRGVRKNWLKSNTPTVKPEHG